MSEFRNESYYLDRLLDEQGVPRKDILDTLTLSQYGRVCKMVEAFQHRVHLTAIAVGGLALCVGIVIGKLWFGA